MIEKILTAIDWRLRVRGDGRIFVEPKSDEPVATFDPLEFDVLETIKMKPSPLWETTKRAAGITRAKYRKYFHGCETAYAFKIGNTVLYETPKELNDYGISTPPQSFTYLTDT